MAVSIGQFLPERELVVCRKQGKRIAQGIAFLAAAVGVVAYRAWLLQRAPVERIHFGLDTHADPLLIGAALACFYSYRGHAPLSAGWGRAIGYLLSPAAVIGIAVVATNWAWYADPVALRTGATVVAVCAIVLVVDSTIGTCGPVRRLLRLPSLVGVGRLSYGVYLWHFPIFSGLHRFGIGSGLEMLLARGVATMVVSAASWYLVERRLLRLKTRFGGTPAPVTAAPPSARA